MYGVLIYPQQNFRSRKTCVFGLNSPLSWIRTKGDVSVACVFDVARIVNFVVIEHKMFLSGILVL